MQQKSKLRRSEGLFVVEGRRELEHCLEAGYSVRTLFVCPEIFSPAEDTPILNSFLDRDFSIRACRPSVEMTKGASLEITKGASLEMIKGASLEMIKGASLEMTKGASIEMTNNDVISSERSESRNLFQVTPEVYSKVAYREGTEGIMAEVYSKPQDLGNLNLPDNPIIIVLESVEKPGNLGAVLRSADAAAASAVIICDPLTDLYNPNLIRASVGAVFTVPVAVASTKETISFLKNKGIKILTAQLQDSSLYYSEQMSGPTAIVMGTESTGLSQEWRAAADAHIRIPMLGRLDSLNVSVSAAILLFEALRQRTEK